jgi:hypothetical protein
MKLWRISGATFVASILLATYVGAVEPVAAIKINEVELNPSGRDAGKEWIELVNEGEEAVDLAGWTITFNYRTEGQLVLSETSLILRPGEFYVFTYPSLMLRNADRTVIELRDPSGILVYRTPGLDDEENDGQTHQRADLGADPLFGDLWVLAPGTRGKMNKIEIKSP